ncbi:MAG: response regulator transcription factor, partial [Casimicrobiaceae bacterium]
MIAVAIADDHAIVRRGVAQIVSAESDMSVVGEASNYGEVMELVRRGGIDCLLLDISMPGRNGIETLKQVKIEAPRIAVLVISM